MLTQERYQTILQLLNEKNSVTVSELTKLLNTSESTIRRDLATLDEMGKLHKVFGGATSLRQTAGAFEDSVIMRENVMSEEKTAIAKYSATLISDSDFVYIDAGTTTSRLIDYLGNNKATYVTNGISHAKKLIAKGFTTYTVGGRIKAATEAIVGGEAVRTLKGFNFTKAFMGTNGIDLEAGFTTPDIEEGLIKEEAVRKSYMAFVLADSSKFRRVFAITFSELRKCCIITDRLKFRDFGKETVIKEVMS